MTADTSRMTRATTESSADEVRVALHQEVVIVAARELQRALLEQSRPMMGMYARPSGADNAAVQRAVHAICAEAHRVDLRVEELIIGIKQAWSQLAPVRARHLGDRDADVLREVVSSTIEVFFTSYDAASRRVLD